MALRLIALIIILTSSSLALAQTENDPSYLESIRQELARLSLSASCQPSSHTCVFTHDLGDEQRKISVNIRFSSATNTVYIFIERFLSLGDSNGPDIQLAQRLLDLNRQMVTAKFEWDKTNNSIRFSTTLNTDSNFDRKAFRSQVLGLLANAKRIWPELKKYMSNVD